MNPKTPTLIILIFAILISGCTTPNTYNPPVQQPYTHTSIPTVDPFPTILKEANLLNDNCRIEIHTTNDLWTMLTSNDPNEKLHDENDILLVVEQKQRQDYVCQLCINYLKANQEILDSRATPKRWASDTIVNHEINKRTNENWYAEAENFLGYSLPHNPLPTYVATPKPTPTSTHTTVIIIPAGQTELKKLYFQKLESWEKSVVDMAEASTTGIQSNSCTPNFKQSVTYCENSCKQFRFWLNDNRQELERTGIPVSTQIAAIEATLLTCDEFNTLCAELPTIVWGGY